jgi:hypothetical protein
MMPAHGRLSRPEMTHHESRIKEEEEDNISADTPTTPTSQGKIKSLDLRLFKTNNCEFSGLSTGSPLSSSNTKSLERLSERSYFKDWVRLKLISADSMSSGTSKGQIQAAEPCRLTTINDRYGFSQR